MNAATKTVLRVAAALLMASAPVGAADQTVPGTQLTLKVSNNGREKLRFRSTGSFTIPTPGSADDPRQNGASLQVFNPNTGETFTFSLPKTHWSLSPSGTQYRYKDSALAESGKVKTARIGTKSLRATGRKIGITLNESSQGVLAVVVASGTFRYCARFDDGSIRRDQPGSFNARRAPAPGSCPVTGTTTTTILPLTTTTLTLPATTTTLTIPATTTTLTLPATTTTLTLPITTTTLTSPITTTTLTSPITTTTVTSPITTSTLLTTTTTTTLITLTSSTASTTTTTSAVSTTTTQPLSLKFTNDPGTTSCGGAGLSPAPASPFTGKLFSDDTCSTQTNDLGRGCLYIGGGNAKAIPPGAVPSGATSYFDINGSNLLASDGTGTLDCTKAAGPGKYCLNNDALPACTSDATCGGLTAACHEAANCYFGPPLEFPNPILTSLSTCAINVVQTDGGGTGTPSTGDSSVTLPLSSWVYVTGNVTHPCPHCVGTTCEYGSGTGSCVTTASSGTSQDCPPTRGGGAFQAPLSVTLSPLTTGSTSLTSASGNFCPSQKTAGAFAVSGARCVQTTGAAAGDLTDGLPHAGAILASAFCIPTTTNTTIDGVADLPGPGLTSLPGTAQIVPTP
jgi:hypothetical protein